MCYRLRTYALNQHYWPQCWVLRRLVGQLRSRTSPSSLTVGQGPCWQQQEWSLDEDLLRNCMILTTPWLIQRFIVVLQQRSKLEHCFLLAEILWNVRATSGVSVVWCWSLLSGTFACQSSWWLFGSYSKSKWVRPWCKLIHCLGHFQDSGYCCLHHLSWSLGKNRPRFLLDRPSCCLQYLGIRDCTYSQLSPAGCQGTGALSDLSGCQNTSVGFSLGSRWVS